MRQNFLIGEREVGLGKPAYVIAEIGSNHDQDLGKAKALIDIAAEAGADAAKFQSLNFEKVHLPAQSGLEMAKLYEHIKLSEDWYAPLAEHCRRRGVHFLSAPTYMEAVDLLVEAGVPAIKIASAQFDIYSRLVSAAAQTGLPLIMSEGLADYGGIERMLSLVRKAGNDRIILLHCITEYPAKASRVNLRMVQTLRETFKCLTGYSDHTLGVLAAPMAVALGAVVIEKHITLDRSGDGPDHHFAAMPDELTQMIRQIRAVETMLGDGIKSPLNDAEIRQREAFLYKWVAAERLPAGSRPDPAKLDLRRMDGGIPEHLGDLMARYHLVRDVEVGHPINWSDLAAES